MTATLSLFGRFFGCRKGVSAIETAAIIPLILAVGIGVAEVGRYAYASMKMQAAATQLADVVSRGEQAVTTEIDDALLGVRYSTSPFNFRDAGRAIISLITMRDGVPTVAWQRGGGGYASFNSRIGSNGGNAVLLAGFVLGEGESMLTAEIIFQYSPVISPEIAAAEVYQAAYFRPRRGDLDTLTLASAQ